MICRRQRLTWICSWECYLRFEIMWVFHYVEKKMWRCQGFGCKRQTRYAACCTEDVKECKHTDKLIGCKNTNTRRDLHIYMNTDTHTHRDTHKPTHTQTLLHTDTVTHRRLYTQTLFHTDTFTHRFFYTENEKSLHTEVFTHRSFFTHRQTYTQTFLHRSF